MSNVVTGALQVDLKRRTTLPGDVLTAAGIPPGSTLVARVEEPGRIVLESPQLLLTLLQDDIAAALSPHPDDTTDPETGEAPLPDEGVEPGPGTSPEGPDASGADAPGAEAPGPGEPGTPAPDDAADHEGRA